MSEAGGGKGQSPKILERNTFHRDWRYLGLLMVVWQYLTLYSGPHNTLHVLYHCTHNGIIIVLILGLHLAVLGWGLFSTPFRDCSGKCLVLCKARD